MMTTFSLWVSSVDYSFLYSCVHKTELLFIHIIFSWKKGKQINFNILPCQGVVNIFLKLIFSFCHRVKVLFVFKSLKTLSVEQKLNVV